MEDLLTEWRNYTAVQKANTLRNSVIKGLEARTEGHLFQECAPANLVADSLAGLNLLHRIFLFAAESPLLVLLRLLQDNACP
jgi:hypothetical protein